MATLTINDLDASTAESLRNRASQHGHSVEVEARLILTHAVAVVIASEDVDLAEAIRRRFAPLGGVDDLVPHPPQYAGDPLDLDE